MDQYGQNQSGKLASGDLFSCMQVPGTISRCFSSGEGLKLYLAAVIWGLQDKPQMVLHLPWNKRQEDQGGMAAWFQVP